MAHASAWVALRRPHAWSLLQTGPCPGVTTSEAVFPELRPAITSARRAVRALLYRAAIFQNQARTPAHPLERGGLARGFPPLTRTLGNIHCLQKPVLLLAGCHWPSDS